MENKNLLSWICYTLEIFHLPHRSANGSNFSLSGLALLRPSANPLGVGALIR